MVVHPTEAILVADSLESRNLAAASTDNLWGSVIAPFDYFPLAYTVANQHNKRANVLMADTGVRLFDADPLNHQIRAGAGATASYWWDSDEQPRANRDYNYRD